MIVDATSYVSDHGQHKVSFCGPQIFESCRRRADRLSRWIAVNSRAVSRSAQREARVIRGDLRRRTPSNFGTTTGR